MKGPRMVLPCIAMAFVAVACGGGKTATTTSPRSSGAGSPASPAGGTGNCASLLQEDEVAAAFGADVGPPEQNSAGGGGLTGITCQWISNGTLAADVSVFTAPSPTAARSQFDQHQQGAAGEDVAGVGDAAFFSEFTGQLEAIDGSKLVRVALGAPEGETDFSGLLPKDKQLMALVLGRV